MFHIYRCIVLAAVFMIYLDRVVVPFPTGCRKQKGSPRVMKLPVLQMFPVRYFLRVPRQFITDYIFFRDAALFTGAHYMSNS